jgi:XTP/dITP diphosphohydrolase
VIFCEAHQYSNVIVGLRERAKTNVEKASCFGFAFLLALLPTMSILVKPSKGSIQQLLVATHNKGKVAEFKDLLEPLGFEVISAADKNLDEPEETGDTFEANAQLKSLAASKATGLIALSDDSGLAVDALDGAPGIYSARWAGPSKDFDKAMKDVHEKLQAMGKIEPADRKGKFVAVLSLAKPDGTTKEYRGEVHGTLVWPPRRNPGQGFGYDPIFQPDGETRTFGEMSSEEKHKISHRARAFELFKKEELGI